MPSRFMYTGEHREYTQNELNFMVKARTACLENQGADKCTPGADCVNCKYGAALQAINELDPLTKARLIDKSDDYIMKLKAANDGYNSYKKQREIKNTLCIIVFIVFILFVALAVGGDVGLCHNTVCGEVKWNKKPITPSTEYLEAWDYDYKQLTNKVMTSLREQGPNDYFDDNLIDCKDWAVTFMYRWYYTYKAPDGTCVLVRQCNRKTKLDHALVAVWTGYKWLVIEPQAFNKTDWSPESYWGYRYNPELNCYNETRKFLMCAVNSYFAEEFIQHTRVDETYTTYWCDYSFADLWHTDVWSY